MIYINPRLERAADTFLRFKENRKVFKLATRAKY